MTKMCQCGHLFDSDEPTSPCAFCRCEVCGGCLDLKATMIGCRSCGMVWGRVNGAWVEERMSTAIRNTSARSAKAPDGCSEITNEPCTCSGTNAVPVMPSDRTAR
jgi:hypothetical protein